MSQSVVCEKLNKHLANLYGLYVKTHNYHWNVTSMYFYSLHSMFQEQYEDLAGAIDEVAERIRQLGQKVPASLGLLAKNSSISDGNENADHKTMVAHLEKDHKSMCEELNAIIAVCGDEDEATKDMAIERLRVHGKAAWMLSASLN